MSVIAGAVGAAAAGYAAWRLRSSPLPPPPQHPDNEECRIAVHEAGHAVLALRCSIVTHVTINMRRESLEPGVGGAVYHRTRHWSPTDIEWCTLVIALGGIAAENAIYGRFRSQPASMDLLRALAGARALIDDGCRTPPWKDTGRTRALKFRAMFAEALTDAEVAILQLAYDTARNTLDRHMRMHGRLTSAIFACGDMSDTVVAQWAGDRSLIRAIGVFQARFI